MKFILSFICCLSSFFAANAQSENLLPFDDKGKFIYYEVVELKDIAKDSLRTRAFSYLNKKNSVLKYKSSSGDTALIATGKLVINKTLLVMSHPSGEIVYNFQTEVKEGKYRFWLTGFSFIPYQRDRYGNFVANTIVGTPLESNPGKLNAAQWKEYQIQAAAHAKTLAGKFKEFMASKAPMVVPMQEKKVVSKTW